MNWLLPESVSTFGPDIDHLYYQILIVTGVIFVLTEALLIYFVIRYRRKEGRKAEYIHGSTKAEIIWTLTPFFIVLYLAVISRGVWVDIRGDDAIPPDAMEVRLLSTQFEWIATYPGPDGEFGTADDVEVRNQLHVPVDRPIKVVLTSDDVIHSFFLPDFRLKQDAVPGMVIPVWFEATETGEYPLVCAELCGIGHYRMGATLTVHSQAGFEEWRQQRYAAVDQ